MKINVKTIPGCSSNKIEKISKSEYKVWLCAQAINNKANQALIKLMAKYFKVSKSQIFIVGGKKCREKILEIID